MHAVRYTQAFIPTLKEAPADAQVASHKLLVRAGFIRQLGAGIYDYLPLAKRSLTKIEAIVREEMNAIGGQEFFLPALHPAEIWKESGRWEVMGDNMFRLKDRKGGDYGLGMTHEEIFTAIARDELRSYRQLPQVWYQIQTKFRDEPRPKSGLLRVRQFTMKDAYSFDVDRAGLDKSYEDQRQAYEKIFTRCGLDFVAVQAHSGSMGGSESSEFMVRTDAGEDLVAACPRCRYAANTETATSRVAAEADGPGLAAPEKFPTPGVVTIEALEQAPHSVPARRQLKTLVYMADERPVIAVVRGDQELNEAKLQTATGAQVVRPAHAEEIPPLMGAHAGSLGAVRFTRARVVVDPSLADRKDMVTGANEDGFHLRGVDVRRDLLAHGATLAELRTVKAGEGCPRCDGALEVFKALEVGHIFKLGTKYSESMKATVLDAGGKQVPIVMGSYGIGVERILAAAIELHHDDNGIVFPMAIAPFHATVLTLGPEPELRKAAEEVVAALGKEGVEVLFDDRDERAGVKFKDADLLGIPIRVAVGKKGLAAGNVEWKLRRGGAVELVPLGEVARKAAEAVRAATT
ncbi:proline--tRNA ligase [Anaeromyxobacter dehalogenans]|uniref:Proline--tRNA ligase 1 n=1 Tax=Anaeromyxobacter dehalogenans (strain 2CP-C) TaxID=290397 RepID=SYP1_ANADE|nr:proline--tRNA ligase [Anaeromyxobacter dehalogenans]Q2IGK6.1 RecName: Full=Proline--tRNA ligase 1; AltName: Full=Prolyl-tRNA synthetase 1; Short=ProRS 1 [Anaeromyxobacter dehalogenans 2CP-C]ABC83711.1 prolyl-tRNA synthetase [Anaeromyxobacter dehalogenans 2CP-C]